MRNLKSLKELSTIDVDESDAQLSAAKQARLQTLYNWLKDFDAKTTTSIENMLALQQLGFSERGITTLPECIGELQALQKLSLAHNQLTTLPEGIGELQALQTLDLSNNQLATLPDSMEHLTALTELNVSDNSQLSHIPCALFASRHEGGPILNICVAQTSALNVIELPEDAAHEASDVLIPLTLGRTEYTCGGVRLFDLNSDKQYQARYCTSGLPPK